MLLLVCGIVKKKRIVNVVERRVGSCQFCAAPRSVDIVEFRLQRWLLGFIPLFETVQRMAVCRACRRKMREVYYKRTMTRTFSDEKIEEQEQIDEENPDGEVRAIQIV
jgi:hypothetical protein